MGVKHIEAKIAHFGVGHFPAVAVSIAEMPDIRADSTAII